MWDWLLSPIDASRGHDFAGLATWHARLMVLSWGVLLPSGVLVARYFKVLPGQDWPRELDNKVWWHSHLVLQISGAVLMVVGVIVAVWTRGNQDISWTHRWLGWAITAFALCQVTSGWMRGTKGGPTAPAPDGTLRGDHYDMTRKRLLFEMVHKQLGYLLIGLAACNVIGGLWAVNAALWMWLAILGFWIALLTIALLRQTFGRTIATYEAIWGPDKSHPGNQR